MNTGRPQGEAAIDEPLTDTEREILDRVAAMQPTTGDRRGTPLAALSTLMAIAACAGPIEPPPLPRRAPAPKLTRKQRLQKRRKKGKRR